MYGQFLSQASNFSLLLVTSVQFSSVYFGNTLHNNTKLNNTKNVTTGYLPPPPPPSPTDPPNQAPGDVDGIYRPRVMRYSITSGVYPWRHLGTII